MKRPLIILFAFWAALLQAQDVPFIKAGQIGQWKNASGDTVYVLNFWATWCSPCVAELPEFEKLTAHFSDKKVQVILINTDFKKDVATRVVPFVQKRQLKSKVVFMDEPTPNKWIDSVNADWSGGIPATLIVCKNKNFDRFYEQQMSYEDLEKAVQAALDK
jgi:thiol-disulfide isomerase/thioredoxin